MSKKTLDTNLNKEAEAFDDQILERLAGGFKPDLRRAEECQFFYNNTWRHPDYVALDFGEQFALIYDSLRKYCGKTEKAPVVCEVGCGPGYLSLELARNGCNVTGVDLSQTSIDTAQRFADEDPWKTERNKLCYRCGDFFDEKLLPANNFDAVIFLGSLHHFPDQVRVMTNVQRLLKEDGIIIVHEPTRDRMSQGNATFIHLAQLLLAVGGGFYKSVEIPDSKDKQRNEVEKIYNSMRYEDEDGEKLQSVNDNEAGFDEMMSGLKKYYQQITFSDRYAFFHEMIGGLRYDEKTNKKLARYLRDADAELCRLGVLSPTAFFIDGKQENGGWLV